VSWGSEKQQQNNEKCSIIKYISFPNKSFLLVTTPRLGNGERKLFCHSLCLLACFSPRQASKQQQQQKSNVAPSSAPRERVTEVNDIEK